MRSMRSFEGTMLRRLRLTRNRTAAQEVFPFVVRSRRRVRWFKRAITVATIGVVVALIAAAPRGRYLVMSLAEQSRQLAMRTAGTPADRAQIDREWTRYRMQGVEDTAREFRKVYSELDPALGG